jgi:hypothetical protein
MAVVFISEIFMTKTGSASVFIEKRDLQIWLKAGWVKA